MYSYFIKLLACLMAVLLSAVAVTNGAPSAGSPYDVESPQELLLYAALVADTHVDGNPVRDRNIVLEKAFSGIFKNKTPLDALVMAGDNTNAADWDEYVNLEALMMMYNRAGQIVPAMGNHDSGGTSEGTEDEKTFPASGARFRDFLRYCGIESERNYYSVVVNGFYFVVLGTEAMLLNDAYLSRTQLQWLDRTLTDAQTSGKPFFLIVHQPLSGLNASGEVLDILKTHAAAGQTILYISGHWHAPFSQQSFTNPAPGLYFLNLPSLLDTDGGGFGALLEVYFDRILIRPRNFIAGEWMEMEYRIQF
ncbi:MAG: metallophosphoesterase [Clostridia bacterium]|nr:metallophosphoesterase [Clostridia bacterium]